MTDPGRPPTFRARLMVVLLAVLGLCVGALWMKVAATGELYAGLPPWVLGVLAVGLLVALAFAVHKVHGHAAP